MRSWQSGDRFYTVCISDEAIRNFGQMARSAAPLETGTPLVGEYSDDQSTDGKPAERQLRLC